MTLVTWNVQRAGAERTRRQAAWLCEQAPDVVVLTEVRPLPGPCCPTSSEGRVTIWWESTIPPRARGWSWPPAAVGWYGSPAHFGRWRTGATRCYAWVGSRWP